MNLNRYLVLLCGFIVILVGFIQAQDVDKLNQINTQIEANNRIIKNKKMIKQTAERDLSNLNRELRYLNRKLAETKVKLERTQQAATQTQAELGKTEQEFKSKQDQFAKRLRQYYENQVLILGPIWMLTDDPQDYEDQSFIFERIVRSDVALITDLKKTKEVLAVTRERLDAQTRYISTLKSDMASKEKQISKKSVQQQQYIGELSDQIEEMEEQNRQLEKASNEIAQYIQRQGLKDQKYYGTGSFIKPTDGWLSSLFGFRFHPIFRRKIQHNGIDLAAPAGYRIKAADSGVVIVAGEKDIYRGYGKVTVIDHGKRKDGSRISTVYAHQSRILVKEGDFVTRGEEIGWVGSTGYSTGPHLHFEVREDGVPVNPLKYLKL